MTQNLYSIRMRASQGDKHVSGAERLVSAEKIDETVQAMISRARSRDRIPDRIKVTIDNIESPTLRTLTALDVVTLNAPDAGAGRTAASHVLETAGVSADAIEIAIDYLTKGAAPSGDNMRGAMIMDGRTGERVEPDQERGVRVSRFDWSSDAGEKIDTQLKDVGLAHFRTREALALATKVVHAPGVIAELCWSDEPDYTAGYVASIKTGYVRFPFLKKHGDPRGGRVFFVKRSAFDMQSLINYLQAEPVLVSDTGICRKEMSREEYFSSLKAESNGHV